MSAVMYHPQTQATIVVSPDAVPQYRQSGWLLRSEWDANQAAAAQDTAISSGDVTVEAQTATADGAAQATETDEEN
jgi:hypothetical protein